MRAVWLCALVAVAACNPATSPTASVTSSPLHPPSASPTAAATPEAIGPGYGLLIAGGRLEMINTRGEVAASAPIHPPTIGRCANGLPVAVPPPVSATLDRVYFRDYDTTIFSLALDGTIRQSTRVPGGSNESISMVSFFSVSPDDTRIAVVVVTLSPTMITERLYVEDLAGGGNHAEIYSTSTPNGAAGRLLWPMGWYKGNLLLALMPACADDPSRLSPIEWHYSSSSTGNRITTIKVSCPPQGHPGYLSRWPSPAGVMCEGAFPNAAIYSWEGATTSVGHWLSGDNLIDAELSPSGRQFVEVWINPSQAWQQIVGLGTAAYIEGHGPCLWIDETHLLAPDAVIGVPDPSTPGISPQPCPCLKASVAALAQAGVCAGRYPNPL